MKIVEYKLSTERHPCLTVMQSAHNAQDFHEKREMLFLKLIVAGHSTLYITRTEGWFWQRPWAYALVEFVVNNVIKMVAYWLLQRRINYV
jgi:hypothetical protein